MALSGPALHFSHGCPCTNRHIPHLFSAIPNCLWAVSLRQRSEMREHETFEKTILFPQVVCSVSLPCYLSATHLWFCKAAKSLEAGRVIVEESD